MTDSTDPTHPMRAWREPLRVILPPGLPPPGRGPLPVAVVAPTAGDCSPPDQAAGTHVAAALTYLQLKVRILKARGQLDRISDEVLAMLPALPGRHTAVALVTEAKDLLRGGTADEGWVPAPEPPIAWYDPDSTDADPPPPARPGPVGPDRPGLRRPPSWLSAWDQAFPGP